MVRVTEESAADKGSCHAAQLRHKPGTVVVVGPGLGDKGGISAVNRVYGLAGLFEGRTRTSASSGTGTIPALVKGAYRVRYFESACDGLRLVKVFYGIHRVLQFALTRLPPPAVVHLHASVGVSFLRKSVYLWLGRHKGARILLHIHPSSFWDDFQSAGRLKRRVALWALRNSDLVVVLTEGAMAKALTLVPQANVAVLPNPVNAEELRLEPRPRRSTDLILFLGWYVRSKGVFDLIEALGRLREAHPELRAVFGGFKGTHQVRRAVRDLGLSDRVQVCGWLDRGEVTRLLHTCTIIVLPSYTEGVPMVLLEAMACGTPIITCPVGGIPEVVRDPRNALYVRPGDIEGLVEAIHTLLLDPVARNSQSECNESDALRFKVGPLMKQLMENYTKLLSSD